MELLNAVKEILLDLPFWERHIIFLGLFSLGAIGVWLFQTDLLLFISGALGAQELLDIRVTLFFAPLFICLGDCLVYSLGRSLGMNALRVWPFYKILNKSVVLKLYRLFNIQGSKLIMLARFVPGTRFAGLITYGIFKIHFGVFLLSNLVALFAFSIIMQALGYYFGAGLKEGWSVTSSVFMILGFLGLGLIIIVIKNHIRLNKI